MKITKEELANIKMVNDRVLIKLDKLSNDRITTKSGFTLFTTPGWLISEHVNTLGTVEAAPVDLHSNLKVKTSDIEFNPYNIPLKKGDKVYVDIRTMIMALGKLLDQNIEMPRETWYECEGQYYVIIPYQEIFIAMRPEPGIDKSYIDLLPKTGEDNFSDKLIECSNGFNYEGVLINSDGEIYRMFMLNGYCLVELIEELAAKTTLIIPEAYKKVYQKRVRVVMAAPPNKEYNEAVYRDYQGDKLRPGVIAHHQRFANLRSENYYHVTLAGRDRKLNVVQNRYFTCVEEEV